MNTENEKVVVENNALDSRLQKIEDVRVVLNDKYKKHSILKNVVVFAALLIVGFACLGVTNLVSDSKVGTALMVILVVLAIAGMLLYSTLIKKKMDKLMKNYLETYYKEMNEYTFEDSQYHDVELQKPAQLNKTQFDENLMFKDTVSVGSRGLTSLTYKDLPIMICDAASQYNNGKRLAVSFAGKYLFTKASYEKEEPIIIYLKGDERTLPPTNVEGYELVSDDDGILIWTNNKEWEKTINASFKKALKGIELNKYLVDVSLSVYSGRVFVCMGYDDALMVLPLQNSVRPAPYDSFKEDLKSVLKVVEVLNK